MPLRNTERPSVKGSRWSVRCVLGTSPALTFHPHSPPGWVLLEGILGGLQMSPALVSRAICPKELLMPLQSPFTGGTTLTLFLQRLPGVA